MNNSMDLIFKNFLRLLLFQLVFSAFSSAYAAEERHINLLVLQAKQPNTNFDSIITGNLGQLITSLEKDAHVLIATRTASVQDRDVINVQTDVLRLTSKNVLANGGFNCRFIFDDESDEDSAFYSISGICDELTAGNKGTAEKKAIIKRTMLSEPSPSFNMWAKLYEDKSSGVVFYVDID